jgi:hypothetical protein
VTFTTNGPPTTLSAAMSGVRPARSRSETSVFLIKSTIPIRSLTSKENLKKRQIHVKFIFPLLIGNTRLKVDPAPSARSPTRRKLLCRATMAAHRR